jgi:hypothetical protein
VVYRSVDGGYQWDELLSGSFKINDFSVYDLNPNFIYATGLDSNVMVVFRTENGGENWTRYYFDGIKLGGRSIALDPLDHNTAFAVGMHEDNGIPVNVVIRTTDGGLDWVEIWRESLKAFVNEIAVDSASRGRIYAGTLDGVYISTDYGDSWIEPVDTIPSDGDIIINYQSPNVVYTIGDGKIYRSHDYGVSWERVDRNLDFNGAICLNYDPRDKTIYIGTGGGGIYEGEWIQTGIDDGYNPGIPAAFELHRNYPNPFNIATAIPYRLPSAAAVKLEVFDLLGRRVATLIYGFQQPGNKNVVWNADGHASGMYFYRLTVDGHSAARPMMLLK